MAAFSSAGQLRRRSVPVNISMRRARSGIGVSSDIDMGRSSKPAPNFTPHARLRKALPRRRLLLTDIATGWTECGPLLVREQGLLSAVLTELRKLLPFDLLGFDTDNDSVFMNETVRDYCQAAGIAFTRCRPYRKNDQAFVEQKNGAVVERVGPAPAAPLVRLGLRGGPDLPLPPGRPQPRQKRLDRRCIDHSGPVSVLIGKLHGVTQARSGATNRPCASASAGNIGVRQRTISSGAFLREATRPSSRSSRYTWPRVA